MSITNLMGMKCTVERQIELTVAQKMDEYANSEPQWELIKEGVKCRVQNYELSYGKLDLKSEGVVPGNTFLGFFPMTEDIRYGDRITVTSHNGFPVLYILAVNSTINARTNKSSHFEVLLNIERK